MTPNEIISKARGECRHNGNYNKSNDIVECECGFKGKDGHQWHWHLENVIGRGASESGALTRLDYDKNPSAWGSDLYQWIEERGLKARFRDHLMMIIQTSDSLWGLIISTPAQKAEALTRAIQEVGE